jgi:hypothetical protein
VHAAADADFLFDVPGFTIAREPRAARHRPTLLLAKVMSVLLQA